MLGAELPLWDGPESAVPAHWRECSAELRSAGWSFVQPTPDQAGSKILRWPPAHYFYCGGDRGGEKHYRALLEPDGRSPLEAASSIGDREEAITRLHALLRGRKVLFLGESQLMQGWLASMCLLRADLSGAGFGVGRRAGYIDQQPCRGRGCRNEHPYFPGLQSIGLIFTCVRLRPQQAQQSSQHDDGEREGELCYVKQNIGDTGCKTCGPGGSFRGVALAHLLGRLTRPTGYTALENQTQA